MTSQLTFSENIGNAVKCLRMQQGMSQEELAENVGITQGMISLIENGKRSNRISWDTLQSIAQVIHPSKTLTGLVAMAENVPEIDEIIQKAKELLVELKAR